MIDLAARLPSKGGWLNRVLRHPLAMPYNRLAILVAALNLLLLKSVEMSLSSVLSAILLNFALATVIRSQYIINILFAIATSAPKSWPIQIRWALGKVYHFGGIHVGAYFSGACWLTFLIFNFTPDMSSVILVVYWFHLSLLLLVILVALPNFRAKYHNTFEIVARFGGWISLLLFWIESLYWGSGTLQLLILGFVTLVVALPWLKLKKVPVNLTIPSSHVALAKFDYGVTPFAGSSTDLSRNPLLEWHSFANVPSPSEEGFRLTISRAGDWTGRLIDEKPDHIWVKGIPAAGVGNVEKLFKKVIWVATGSGIGPCLPHLLSKEVPSHLVWSTKNPEKTFGIELVNEILAVQPDALIWDTDSRGKPDLVRLAYEAYKKFDAEAVICIANKKVTWNVTYELECRGIPTFGAIWDS